MATAANEEERETREEETATAEGETGELSEEAVTAPASPVVEAKVIVDDVAPIDSIVAPAESNFVPTPSNAEPEAATASANSVKEAVPEEEEIEGAIWDPAENDVLSGRGASVNSHPGNKKFRAICFARKTEFEAGNHTTKRRVATEIVDTTISKYGSRFLRKKQDKGPWLEMTKVQAILKASQVMRDHRRPDRMAQRALMAAHSKKRNRAVSTPMDDVDVVVQPVPLEPIVETPRGVNNNDVLCGRGAFVNGHVGNHQLRILGTERKARFEAGNYAEKKTVATEIVNHIRSLDPPGRFLKRVDPSKPLPKDAVLAIPPDGDEPGWEEVDEEKAIHKACQVMRDIDRVDRRDRDERRRLKKLKKEGLVPPPAGEDDDAKLDAASAQDPVPMEIAPAIPGISEMMKEAVSVAEAVVGKEFEPTKEDEEHQTTMV